MFSWLKNKSQAFIDKLSSNDKGSRETEILENFQSDSSTEALDDVNDFEIVIESGFESFEEQAIPETIQPIYPYEVVWLELNLDCSQGIVLMKKKRILI